MTHPSLSLRLITALIACTVLLSSCSTSRKSTTARRANQSTAHTGPSGKSSGKKITFSIPSNADNATERLLAEAKSWLGTPYKYGGNTTQGVDCSGFVLQVYLKALDIKLPRNSAKQQEYCRAIRKEQLTAGDLVFFTLRGGSKVGHVGIYIGDNKIVHASSSKGVIVSELSQKYYVDNYHSCGRVAQFYAMKSKSGKSDKSTQRPDDNNIAIARTSPENTSATVPAATKSPAAPQPRKIKTVKATPKAATAAAMEENRQKALRALLEQVEDSLETSAHK